MIITNSIKNAFIKLLVISTKQLYDINVISRINFIKKMIKIVSFSTTSYNFHDGLKNLSY